MFAGHPFCSDNCAGAYKMQNSVSCECGRSFIKKDGIPLSGMWYCSDECVEREAEQEDSVEIDL